MGEASFDREECFCTESTMNFLRFSVNENIIWIYLHLCGGEYEITINKCFIRRSRHV